MLFKKHSFISGAISYEYFQIWEKHETIMHHVGEEDARAKDV